MDVVFQIIRDSIVPGSAPFLLLGLTLGVLLLMAGSRCQGWGRRWLVTLAALYWAMSLPIVADTAEGMLAGDYRPATVREARRADTVVVLGGGNQTYGAAGRELNLVTPESAFAVLEAARLYHLMDEPLIIVSGGIARRWVGSPESEAMRKSLLDLGIPDERILEESVSRNTHEQALNLTRLLRTHRIDRFVLVTRPAHMRRAMIMFEAQGTRPIPSVSRTHSADLAPPSSWLPDWGAWSTSYQVVHQYLALAYAWGRGWLESPRTLGTAHR